MFTAYSPKTISRVNAGLMKSLICSLINSNIITLRKEYTLEHVFQMIDCLDSLNSPPSGEVEAIIKSVQKLSSSAGTPFFAEDLSEDIAPVGSVLEFSIQVNGVSVCTISSTKVGSLIVSLVVGGTVTLFSLYYLLDYLKFTAILNAVVNLMNRIGSDEGRLQAALVLLDKLPTPQPPVPPPVLTGP